MKIAIYTDAFLPKIDGIVTSTISTAKELAKMGHKIFIIAPKYSEMKKEFSYPNIKVRRVASMPALFYEGFKFTSFFNPLITNYIRKNKIEIIHFHTPFTLGVQAIADAKLLRLPLIGTFNTLITEPQYLKHIGLSSSWAKTFAKSYVRYFYNRCDLITVPTDIIKNEIKTYLKPPIKTISYGIEFGSFDNSNWKKVKKKYNPDGKLLLSVSRIAYEKNIPYLLECFKLILKNFPKTKLLLIGDGPQMELIKNKIKSLGILDNVILTGEINHENLSKSSIFAASDVFVTASTTETMGISTLEAQKNGVVCVGVDSKGIKEIINNGYNGYLARRGDKLDFAKKVEKLLQNKKIYLKMKTNALKEIDKRDVKKIAKIWEQTYNMLIKNEI